MKAVYQEPKPYRATVALVKPLDQSTEYDQFTYVDKYFDSLPAARLWAAKICKNHPDSSGSATVHQRTWEFDEVWYMASEDCVWST